MENELTQRVRTLNEAFQLPLFRKQLESWRQEKSSNQSILSEEWNTDEGRAQEFARFWQRPPSVDCIREAMILTAMEDISESLAGAFVTIVCPDLDTLQQSAVVSAQILQQTKDEVNATPANVPSLTPEDSGDATISLYERALHIFKYTLRGEENQSNWFDRDAVMASISEAQLEKPDFILHSMLLVRSCVLLQFAINLWITWDTNKDSFSVEDSEAAPSDPTDNSCV